MYAGSHGFLSTEEMLLGMTNWRHFAEFSLGRAKGHHRRESRDIVQRICYLGCFLFLTRPLLVGDLFTVNKKH